MKQQGRIFYVFIAIFLVLAVVLVSNCMHVHHFEKDQVKKRTAAAIDSAAAVIQNYNGSLVNSMAQMTTDSEYAEKIAFAAGATLNRSKLVLYFDKVPAMNDHMVSKEPKPVINRSFLKQHDIHYKPEAVKNIHQYDSVLKQILRDEQLQIVYEIRPALRKDTIVAGLPYISRPFIIDFFQPKIYVVYYNIPGLVVWKSIGPHLAGTLFMLLLAMAMLVFYYRAYRLNVEMAGFKEELFSNIAHELKTPLSSLQLIVDASQVNDEEQPTMTDEHLRFARSELNRMKFIVDKLLSVGRMNKEQFALVKELVQMDEVVRDAIDIMGMATAQRQAILKYEGGAAAVTGDKLLLTNCMTALIDNALKYADEKPVIYLRLLKQNNQAVVEVQDNGAGIAQDYQKKIFEPLFRVPNANRHDVKGHGLGLSMTAQVVQLHGGRIDIKSAQGKGSIFTISIPLV